MDQDIKNKAIGGLFGSVGAAIVLGILVFLWDWNTTDDEVIPTVEVQQQQLEVAQDTLEEVAEAVEELEQAQEIQARYVLKKEIRDRSEEIRRLEKSRDDWDTLDLERYETANDDLDTAWEALDELDDD